MSPVMIGGMGWSTFSASVCTTPSWGECSMCWRAGLLFRGSWKGWRNGLSRLHGVQQDQVGDLVYVKGSHGTVEAVRMLLCRKVSNIVVGPPEKLQNRWGVQDLVRRGPKQPRLFRPCLSTRLDWTSSEVSLPPKLWFYNYMLFPV